MYIPRLLPILGFQSSFPRAVTFAHKSIGGIGLVPLNFVITQRKITFMMPQLRSDTELGKVLLIHLRWAKLQSGRQAPVFTSKDNIEYIENPWVAYYIPKLFELFIHSAVLFTSPRRRARLLFSKTYTQVGFPLCISDLCYGLLLPILLENPFQFGK